VDGGDGSCLVSSPPDVDVDTPEQLPPRWSPSPRPETLVADTPEEDYGLRVTWRRRKGLMMALERGGHLSKVDTMVPL